jgi:hypothetical protein
MDVVLELDAATGARYTDRVYYPLPPQYRWRLFGGEAPRGDRYPLFAVTWPSLDAEVARAVLEQTPERLRLSLYSFKKTKPCPVEVLAPEAGRYEWRSGTPGKSSW